MVLNTKPALALVAALALAAGAAWLALRMEGEPPAITFVQEPRVVGRAASWAFAAEDRKSGLRQLRAWVRQGEKTVPLLSEDFAGRGTHRREATLAVDPQALGLADGAATLVVGAQDHSLKGFKGNSVFREVALVVDTQPPRLDLLGTQHNVNRGGAGVLAYRLSEAAARTGVLVGERLYPGHPEAAGGAGAHVAYFAIPHDAPAGVAVALVAVDAAGNEVRRAVPVRLLEKVFRADTIDVSDRFLAAKVPEFRAADPALPAGPVEAFLAVNRDWRARDHARIAAAATGGAAERLWDGPFLQMPNTKNMAGWAESRTYLHAGKVIDRQTHLGIDLASTAGAPVPAANAGVVAFTGDVGIYGRSVVLDHGQGLFSLYAHLSGVGVEQGRRVARGEIIGTSGQTGMAGGDHLHFSVLVSGTFVNPEEWYDGHWIADNVAGKLAALGPAAVPAVH